MRLKDALRISAKNIRMHLKRNLMLMVVMGVIFGLILTVNLWFQGMANTYVDLAGRVTDGKVIIEAINLVDGPIEGVGEQATWEEMAEDIEGFGGKVLGDEEKFGMYGAVVVSEDLVKNAVEVDIAKAPADAAPVLASTFLGEQLLGKSFSTGYFEMDEKMGNYEQYRKDIIGKTFTDAQGAKYYVVGLTAGSFNVYNMSFEDLERSNDNVLNPLLGLIVVPGGTPIVINNGKQDSWQTGEPVEGIMPITIPEYDSIVAVFDNDRSAYEYFRQGKGKFASVDLPGRTYSVNVIAGMSPETLYTMKIMKFVINIASVTLGVVAMVVVIFTSIRLVDQDRRNIALYYSLGATSGQVRRIYLCYFLELIIGAAILAFVVASVIVLLFSIINQATLSIQATLAFNLSTRGTVVWYGVNISTFVTIAAMMLMAPISVMVNGKRLAKVLPKEINK